MQNIKPLAASVGVLGVYVSLGGCHTPRAYWLWGLARVEKPTRSKSTIGSENTCKDKYASFGWVWGFEDYPHVSLAPSKLCTLKTKGDFCGICSNFFPDGLFYTLHLNVVVHTPFSRSTYPTFRGIQMKIPFFQLIDSQRLLPQLPRSCEAESAVNFRLQHAVVGERCPLCLSAVTAGWRQRGNRSVTVPSLSLIWHLPSHSTFGWADSSTSPLPFLSFLFLSFPILRHLLVGIQSHV